MSDAATGTAWREVWRRDRLAAVVLWTCAVLVFSWSRPFLPLDETRYLAVAWGMWVRGDLLVPMLNGEFYAHKTPLLFWLLHLGWGALAWSDALVDAWTRLLPVLITLGAALSLAAVARRAYGAQSAALAALIYLGTLGVAVQASLVMFDQLLILCLALSMVPLVGACRDGDPRAWALSGVALGAALLAKGPIVFLYYLPLALLPPPGWRERCAARRWALGVGVALAAALLVFAAWLAPLLLDDAARAELLRQVTERLSADAGSGEIGHHRPFWYYLPFLPLLMLPWVFVRPLWPIGRELTAEDIWLLRAGLIALLVLSLISNKQSHYLLPIIAMLTPMWAGGWLQASSKRRAWVLAVLASLPVLFGALLLLARALLSADPGTAWLDETSPAWAVLMLLSGGVVPLLWKHLRGVVLVLPASVLLLILGVGFIPAAGDRISVAPMSATVAAAVERGEAVAYLGNYQGQFHYVGRLPDVVIRELHAGQVARWLQRNPDGLLITRAKRAEVDETVVPVARQAYRSGELLAYRARDLLGEAAEFRNCWPRFQTCDGG